MVQRESRRLGLIGRRLRSGPGVVMIRAMFAGSVIKAAMAAALAGPLAAGAPVSPPREIPTVLVGGCHGDAQRHFVPEFRDTVRHSHRSGDCRPLAEREAKPPPDCHRDVRRHAVRGMGVVLHRHVGKDCSVRRVNRSTEPKP